MSETLAALEVEVRELVRRRGVDPWADHSATRRLVNEVVDDWGDRSLAGLVPPLVSVDDASRRLMDTVAGLGPLQPYLDDPTVEELWLNGPDQLFVARSGRSELTPVMIDHQSIKDLVERMLRTSGRRIDMSQPFVDAALPGGERLHVVIPPVTGAHWAVNIRKFVARMRSLQDLVRAGSLTAEAADFLHAAVVAGLNILVSGATQAGKTTMVAAMAASIPASQRVVTCEEVFELNLANRDCVGLQCRQPSLEGTGEIPLRRLVKESLRMRPDRLIVGEVREAEAFDLLIALNSGLPGMSTIHANSAREAVTKLATLPLLAGENVSSAFVTPTVAQALDVVVHLDLDRDGRRSVREILAVTGRVEGATIETSGLFARRQERLVRTGAWTGPTEPFTRAGIEITAVLGRGGSWA
ncbi:MAG TPA: ATPase, T2SS/T4P/T4SS family [Actinomycetaceae bacterium]|nr:ATPase, T2SS/T4P/T4SS family [Actinomycetaceae bacterium]